MEKSTCLNATAEDKITQTNVCQIISDELCAMNETIVIRFSMRRVPLPPGKVVAYLKKQKAAKTM